MQRWRGMPAGGGQEALADIVVFWIFAPLSLAFACFLTTAGDYNRWRVHLDVSLQLISSFFPVFHPSTLTTFSNTSEDTFDCGNFFSNKTVEVFQRNCVKFMEMQDCAFHTALQDWGQLHFRTEQIPEILKMAKNLKNFKDVTTTFTSWQLLTIIVNCCI